MSRYHTRWGIWCQIVMCLGLINTACKQADEPTNDYSAYYIPISTLPGEGATYRYRNMADSLSPPEIWKHTRLGPDRLESVNYTLDGMWILRQYDRYVPSGVMTDSLFMFLADGKGSRTSTKANIVSPNRFPFQPGDTSMVWLHQLEWFQPADSLRVVLQRRRQFEADTVWNYKGKTIPAVRFKVEDTLETEEVGWTSSSWTGVEVYAKGVGLIYYKRHISNDMVLEYALEE